MGHRWQFSFQKTSLFNSARISLWLMLSRIFIAVHSQKMSLQNFGGQSTSRERFTGKWKGRGIFKKRFWMNWNVFFWKCSNQAMSKANTKFERNQSKGILLVQNFASHKWTVHGGFDSNKSTHSGVKFRHQVRVLRSPNKRGVCKRSMLLSWFRGQTIHPVASFVLASNFTNQSYVICCVRSMTEKSCLKDPDPAFRKTVDALN